MIDTERLKDQIRLAISDPGAFIDRQPGQTVASWAADAVWPIIAPLAAIYGQHEELLALADDITSNTADHEDAVRALADWQTQRLIERTTA